MSKINIKNIFKSIAITILTFMIITSILFNFYILTNIVNKLIENTNIDKFNIKSLIINFKFLIPKLLLLIIILILIFCYNICNKLHKNFF